MCIVFELNMIIIYDIIYVIDLDFCCKTDITENEYYIDANVYPYLF